MNLKFEQTGCRAIVYDADCMPPPGPELFDAEYWQRTGAISATAPGRGNALMLETPFGSAVMRAYLRGGRAARLSHDRYLFTGFDRCRPLAEARMLAELTRVVAKRVMQSSFPRIDSSPPAASRDPATRSAQHSLASY